MHGWTNVCMEGWTDRQTLRTALLDQLRRGNVKQMLRGLWHPQMLGWSKMQSLQVATTEF